MPEWGFRIWGEAPPLSSEERREVEDEVSRLRVLVAALPGRAIVRVDNNPSGILGEYVGLLMEAVARGVLRDVVLPAHRRQRYEHRRWFAVSLESLDAFVANLVAERARAGSRAPQER